MKTFFKPKFCLAATLLFFSIFTPAIMANALQPAKEDSSNNEAHLIIDSLRYDTMPKHFRTTSSLTALDNKKLNLKGLDRLNISGSQQFSAFNLPLVLKAINTAMPVIDVDLRQESHGFINGIPVSWKNEKNNANMGLSLEQIIAKENELLKSIKLNQPISFYNHPEIKVVPTQVESENQLVSSKGLSYLRIPVTDGKLPTDGMVDYFIDFVKAQPPNTWIHFHCKEGVGRTTTFMIMYDIVKNAKTVPYDEIIKRQLALAGFDEKEIQSFYSKSRAQFLSSFYKYSKENGDKFQVKWSDYIKK
ncbi:fused DSP-PTPase phosphatase/NAD kinase-like protein [Clostridium polynesiense]|uniref:phosphatase domain-containing putative toxin n=1 Tax=Clostridium polynesiense TaxID=1325933 RepID=UPI000591084D|nr:phytase [Clostridium polynesiense]